VPRDRNRQLITGRVREDLGETLGVDFHTPNK